ncbi:MAG: efflux RND transporter permease subunit [Thermomicrobiales bacterium]
MQTGCEFNLSPGEISPACGISSASTVTTVQLDGGPTPVLLQMSGGDISTIDELEQLQIASGVTLGQVATLSEAEQQVSITRVDGNPAASITADITSDNTGGVSAEVQSAVNELDVPEGIDVAFGGVAGDIEQGFTDMFVAIIISIVLVYAIMALLFGSWLDPFVILFSLPLASIGAIVALFVTNTSLSISALIGVLMLVGIVVTNAIVMLEFVIMLRKDHEYSTYEALVEGAQTRLRPILMTAFAAMLALVPLSLGFTEGALIAADLGRTVIGGLFSSTLLTLVVVPVIYSLVDDLKVRFGHGEREAGNQPARQLDASPQPTE